MNWLRRFMMGRYGGDQLSMALLILSIILTLIARLANIPTLALVSYIPLGLCIYRMFSKDISKRSMENYKFAILMSPIYTKFKKVQYHFTDAKTNKYFKCPNCKAKLRVPKNKGKIMITCPKCKTGFIRKT